LNTRLSQRLGAILKAVQHGHRVACSQRETHGVTARYPVLWKANPCFEGATSESVLAGSQSMQLSAVILSYVHRMCSPQFSRNFLTHVAHKNWNAADPVWFCQWATNICRKMSGRGWMRSSLESETKDWLLMSLMGLWKHIQRIKTDEGKLIRWQIHRYNKSFGF
jgi:hypothetical protein